MLDPKQWGFPAAVSFLAPWQQKLTAMELISSYFQPQLGIGASILAPLSAVATVALLQNFSIARLRMRLWLFMSLFFATLFACVLLSNSVDTIWQPEENAAIALRLLWPPLFLTVFVSFAAAATLAQMLLLNAGENRRRRRGGAKIGK